jgi:hypothetical protein
MVFRSRVLYSAAITSLAALLSCNNAATFSPIYLGVNISPRPGTIAVGTSAVFTGTVTNNSVPQWSILDGALTNNPGTLTPVSGAPNQVLYTAPPLPPIYSASPTGITQGTVTLRAAVTDPPGTSTPTVPDSVSFVITAPSITTGLVPAAATVTLGSTQQFFGYAVGNVNNTLTWQLVANGIPGGPALGTINTAGTYVAPSTMPATGNTVTVKVTSVADPNKTSSAVVTLQ